jgi:hypothetical protein
MPDEYSLRIDTSAIGGNMQEIRVAVYKGDEPLLSVADYKVRWGKR